MLLCALIAHVTRQFNIFNAVISLALIFNQYLNPIALKAIAWKYYVSSSLVAYHLSCVRYTDKVPF
jgi:hypothetical protein